MKIIILTGFIFILHTALYAQGDAMSFCHESMQTNNTGMIILGSWALVNIAGGAYGWSAQHGSKKYFHQMNLFWNTVNLTIAGIALIHNYHTDCSLLNKQEMISRHMQTEKILLLNAALDIGYIGTGFLLRNLSGKSEKRTDLLKGYGNSLLVQGSFLLVFDLVLKAILSHQRMDFLSDMRFILSPDLAGLQWITTLSL